jgi:glycosyltransferase involved in cell wall biosynthesis
MPLVSAIIPAYNCEKYIEEAIESVLGQTFRDVEVIVIDDGSTDRTPDRVRQYADNVVYIRQENAGPGAARNRGLGMAMGSLVAFLDADDVWLPLKLERQVEAATSHSEYGIFVADVLTFRGDKVLSRSRRTDMSLRSGRILDDLMFRNTITPSAAMVRRECFDDVGMFPQGIKWGEDWIMWVRIAAKYPVYFMDEVLVRYRVHAESASRSDTEAQFHCVLRNWDLLVDTVPEVRSRLHMVNEGKFHTCLERGSDDLRALRLAMARQKLRLALRCQPYSITARSALLVASLPAPMVRICKGILKWTYRLAARAFGLGRNDAFVGGRCPDSLEKESRSSSDGTAE